MRREGDIGEREAPRVMPVSAHQLLQLRRDLERALHLASFTASRSSSPSTLQPPPAPMPPSQLIAEALRGQVDARSPRG